MKAPALPHPTTLKAMLPGSKAGEGERRLQHASQGFQSIKGSQTRSIFLFLSATVGVLGHAGGRPAHNAAACPLSFIHTLAGLKDCLSFLSLAQAFLILSLGLT